MWYLVFGRMHHENTVSPIFGSMAKMKIKHNISMDERNTILSAYTMYRQYYPKCLYNV